MIKLVKKSVLFCLGVAMLGVMPITVDAASFDWGKPVKENNITRIPIKMKIEETDTVSNFRIGCKSGHTDVTCEVKQLSSPTTLSVYEGLYTYVGETPEEVNFPAGTYELVEVVLTNNDTSKKSELTVKLDGAQIGGVPKSLETQTSVGAKEEEVVKSSNATLTNIQVSQGVISPEFSKDVKEYTVYQIKDTINKIKITATCAEGDCSAVPTGGKSVSGTTITLNMGENKVVLDVTSEDGKNTETYILNIIRGETVYNSARLGELSFGDYVLNPTFKPETKKYALTVPNEVTTLTQIIKYATEDPEAKELVSVEGADEFVVGENKLTITVSNVMADETIVYEVIVNRLSEENIEVLKYINNEVTFKDGDGIQTTLSIDEFKKTYPTEYGKITNNEYKFDEDGNKIIEGLLDEEEETDDKEDDKEKKSIDKVWIIVALIAVGLIVIVVSGILIFRKKKPEVEEEVVEETVETEAVVEEDETGIEEAIIGEKFSNTMETTVDIDEALSDLMSTKQYDFKDEE